MRTPSIRTIVVLAAVAALAPALASEKVDMTPEQLSDVATHVVVGRVTAIYQREESQDGYDYTRYLAEVKVDAVEKEAADRAVEKGELLYVRYWTRKAAGFFARPSPGTNGHRGRPAAGETLRIYLARNAYDGFDPKNQDGGFNVIGANGFERISADK